MGITATERWVRTAIVDGAAHVLATGQGSPVVVLNGIGVPAAMLAPLMTRLDGVTQYAVVLPAFGLTDTTPGFADDLRANAVRFLVEVFDGRGLHLPSRGGGRPRAVASPCRPDRPTGLSVLSRLGHSTEA